MGASTVSSGWSNHFIELLEYSSYQDAAVAGLRSLDGACARRKISIARQMARASDPSLVPGTQAFLNKVAAIMAAQSPELVQRAHDLLDAPHLFGMEIGFNLPAFLIALVITAILVIGIKESARFNATIVVIKVAVVLFVIGLGFTYVNPSNWGMDWSLVRALSAFRASARGRPTFSLPISVSTRFRPPRRKPRIRSAICRSESSLRCWSAPCFTLPVAAVLTGMVPWQEVNIEAPIARAFLDRGLNARLRTSSRLGALAGLTSVMLVMLLGQTRVLYSMANDGLLPKKFFAEIHPKFRTPWKNTILVGLLAAIVGSLTPIDDIGKMVNIGTLLAFVIVCIAVLVLRTDQSRSAAALPHAVGAAGADPGHHLQRLHDVQAWLGQLGALDYLAGYWVGGVLQLTATSIAGCRRWRRTGSSGAARYSMFFARPRLRLRTAQNDKM